MRYPVDDDGLCSQRDICLNSGMKYCQEKKPRTVRWGSVGQYSRRVVECGNFTDKREVRK